jgi:hypothetical protein
MRGGFIKYTIEMASGVMIYILSSIETDCDIQN